LGYTGFNKEVVMGFEEDGYDCSYNALQWIGFVLFVAYAVFITYLYLSTKFECKELKELIFENLYVRECVLERMKTEK
jgi:hypothetical protein